MPTQPTQQQPSRHHPAQPSTQAPSQPQQQQGQPQQHQQPDRVPPSQPQRPETDGPGGGLDLDEERNERVLAENRNEGEGSRSAARRYDAHAQRFARDEAKVEQLGEEAEEALDSPEGDELRRADEQGRRGQHGGD
jgi:hypothetical protein